MVQPISLHATLFPPYSSTRAEHGLALSSTASSEVDYDSQSEDGTCNLSNFSPPPSPTRMTRATKLVENKERDRRGVATFHLKSWEEQTWFERALHMGVADSAVYERKPHVNRRSMPIHSPWAENWWILPRSLLAPAIHQTSLWIFPSKSYLFLFQSAVRSGLVRCGEEQQTDRCRSADYKWHVVLSYLVYLFSFFWFMTMTVSLLPPPFRHPGHGHADSRDDLHVATSPADIHHFRRSSASTTSHSTTVHSMRRTKVAIVP